MSLECLNSAIGLGDPYRAWQKNRTSDDKNRHSGTSADAPSYTVGNQVRRGICESRGCCPVRGPSRPRWQNRQRAQVHSGYLSARASQDRRVSCTESGRNTVDGRPRNYWLSCRTSFLRTTQARRGWERRRLWDGPPSQQRVWSLGAKPRLVKSRQEIDKRQAGWLYHPLSETLHTPAQILCCKDNSTRLRRRKCHQCARHSHKTPCRKSNGVLGSSDKPGKNRCRKIRLYERCRQSVEKCLRHTRWDVSIASYAIQITVSRLTPSWTSPTTRILFIGRKFRRRLLQLVATFISQISSRGAAFALFQKWLAFPTCKPRSSRCLWTKSSKQNNIAPKDMREVLKLVNNRFTNVLNFQSYSSISFDQGYEEYVAKLFFENGKTYAGTETPHCIRSGLPNFCPQRSIDAQNDFWKQWSFGKSLYVSFYFLSQKPASSIINSWNSLCSSFNKQFIGALYSYCYVVNYLAATCAPDDVIADAMNNITNCTQPQNVTSVSGAQAPWDKLIRCGTAYDDAMQRESSWKVSLSWNVRQSDIIDPQTSIV